MEQRTEYPHCHLYISSNSQACGTCRAPATWHPTRPCGLAVRLWCWWWRWRRVWRLDRGWTTVCVRVPWLQCARTAGKRGQRDASSAAPLPIVQHGLAPRPSWTHHTCRMVLPVATLTPQSRLCTPFTCMMKFSDTEHRISLSACLGPSAKNAW